jgi:hypothetical protein
MGTQLLDKKGPEGGVFSFAEELPYIRVRECGEGCYFQLEEMVLRRVEVDGVDTAGRVETEGENVVASGGYG